MRFARLVQQRNNAIVHEELQAIWFGQNNIEVMKLSGDRVVFTRFMRASKFWRMIKHGRWVLRQKHHSRGWYYWLGIDDRDLRALARLNTKEHIEDHERWWNRKQLAA